MILKYIFSLIVIINIINQVHAMRTSRAARGTSKACELPKETGTCGNYSIKYFFDTSYGSCTRFWYGGCDGNDNRFETLEECKGICQERTGKEVCLLPKSAGPCTSYYNKWYFDDDRNRCEQFMYGGCYGTNNRFDSLEDCQSLCMVDESIHKSTFTLIRTTSPGTGCPLNHDARNLIIKDLRGNRLQQGDLVSTNTIVTFACESKYTLEGNKRLNCASNGWNDELPICTKYCAKSQIHGISTKADCTYRDQKVKCDNRIRPGTVAYISCATLFTPPRGYSGGSFRKPLTCTEQGSWDLDRPSCTMNCGAIQPETTAFVKDGIDVNITKIPWHVGVYNIFNHEKYEHICGGTIISPSIVVSAAHCYWDKANSMIFDEKFFSVAAGKYYRDYYMAKDDINTQKRNITKIIIHSNYNDAQNLYLNDVALLILENHFKFTDFIRPICIQFRPALSGYVLSNVLGSVAGWGITDDNNPADILQSVSMKTLSHFDCKPSLPENYNLPEDKFCLSNEFGGTACRGDSGGGFFTKQTIDGGQKWYYSLEGIISHAPERTQDCAKNGIVALTSIQVEDIKSLIEANKLDDERKF